MNILFDSDKAISAAVRAGMRAPDIISQGAAFPGVIISGICVNVGAGVYVVSTGHMELSETDAEGDDEHWS